MLKKDSPGPVLFKQKRVGLKEKPFELYKFRSMFIDSSKYEYCPTGADDPRVTKTGRWLRKISLDELPQLINILKGHMSIVGPRPEMQFIVEEYNDVEKKRLLVKPGLTGLWQISRHRSSEITHNMEYDFYYIENQGFVLDFVIIIMTLFFVVRGITH
jgi:lipopolysaccharide/colanic/teichoic acid biosynthesis glycosyltransferase